MHHSARRITAAVAVAAGAVAAGGLLTAGPSCAARPERGARVAAPFAPPCDGPFRTRGRVDAGATRRWEVCYERGGRARLDVRGDGAGDLDCYLYGPTNVLLARDDGDASDCTLEWTPDDSGTHRLEIVNVGREPGDYLAHSL
jgi:hypothetical protein